MNSESRRDLLFNVLMNGVAPLVAILIAFAIGGIVITSLGTNPFAFFSRMLSLNFGSMRGISQMIYRATPYFFTAMALSFAFKAGLFNIGAEGQMFVGGLALAWVGFTFTWLPFPILFILCLVAGFLGGALWGAIPGYLKVKRGAHEVITTIMMNFIAIALVQYIVQNHFMNPDWGIPHTPTVAEGAYAPSLGKIIPWFPAGTRANIMFLVAIILAGLTLVLLQRTKLGYEIRATGLNPNSAEYAGINISSRTVMTMAISGGFAGMATANFILGPGSHYFLKSEYGGIGFSGIAVGLLGRNNPLGIILAAILFGFLENGALGVQLYFPNVPRQIVEIMQAIILIVLVIVLEIARKFLKRLQKRG
ncbi:ABC transporter permease [Candidatus Bipolaricaulota bacterium]|nr:ABC transporter permease [Candidatus Bipolaricaulota bacterium]